MIFSAHRCFFSTAVVSLHCPPPPHLSKLPPHPPPAFTWQISLLHVSLKTMGNPMHSVCHHWIIGFRCTCSSISAESQYGVSVYSHYADSSAAGGLYGVIVYSRLELWKQACHLTDSGHFFQSKMPFLHKAFGWPILPETICLYHYYNIWIAMKRMEMYKIVPDI